MKRTSAIFTAFVIFALSACASGVKNEPNHVDVPDFLLTLNERMLTHSMTCNSGTEKLDQYSDGKNAAVMITLYGRMSYIGLYEIHPHTKFIGWFEVSPNMKSKMVPLSERFLDLRIKAPQLSAWMKNGINAASRVM